MSEFSKRAGLKPCPRCEASLQEVLWIAPVHDDPGLVAYECPSCGYVTSDLTASAPEPGKQQ